jgi:hypothetical protein
LVVACNIGTVERLPKETRADCRLLPAIQGEERIRERPYGTQNRQSARPFLQSSEMEMGPPQPQASV